MEEEKERIFKWKNCSICCIICRIINRNVYLLLRANWSKLSWLHMRHSKSCLRWGVDLWLGCLSGALTERRKKKFFICPAVSVGWKMACSYFHTRKWWLVSWKKKKSAQFKSSYNAVAALGAHIQTLAVEEHQTQSQGNIICAGNLMRGVTRLPCNLHRRNLLYIRKNLIFY